MDRREFLERVATACDGTKAPLLEKSRVVAVFDAMLLEIERALLAKGERVSYWPGVGKFVAHWGRPRVVNNQMSHQCQFIPARYRFRYREDAKLRKAIN